MKAKDLIKKLQEYDPEQEISTCSCMYCAGTESTRLSLDESDVSHYDPETKKVTRVKTISISADY